MIEAVPKTPGQPLCMWSVPENGFAYFTKYVFSGGKPLKQTAQ